MLPVQLPRHLGEEQAALEVGHILPDTPTRAHAEGLEDAPVVRVESVVVVWVGRREPSLGPKLASAAEIALRVRDREDGCLDSVLRGFHGRESVFGHERGGKKRGVCWGVYADAFGDIVSGNSGPWADTRQSKGTVGMHSERLLDHGVDPWDEVSSRLACIRPDRGERKRRYQFTERFVKDTYQGKSATVSPVISSYEENRLRTSSWTFASLPLASRKWTPEVNKLVSGSNPPTITVNNHQVSMYRSSWIQGRLDSS